MDAMDERIDRLLQSAEAPIADDGFSDRVLARLPAKRRLSRETTRRLTLGAAAASGSLLTLLLAPPIESAFDFYSRLDPGIAVIVTAALFVLFVGLPAAWALRPR